MKHNLLPSSNMNSYHHACLKGSKFFRYISIPEAYKRNDYTFYNSSVILWSIELVNSVTKSAKNGRKRSTIHTRSDGNSCGYISFPKAYKTILKDSMVKGNDSS